MAHRLNANSRTDEPFDEPPSRLVLTVHALLLPAYLSIIGSYLLASGSLRAVKRVTG